MTDEQSRRRASGKMKRKTAVDVAETDKNDRMVLTEFVKRPNRAIAVPEMAILLGAQASFNIAASFERLCDALEIYVTASEFHIGPTVGDEVTKSPRYRRVS